MTSTYESEEFEGAHTLAGLGSPLTDAKGDKLFGPWTEFDVSDNGDDNVQVAVHPMPREARYPDGYAPNRGSLSQLSPGRAFSISAGGRGSSVSTAGQPHTTTINPLVERI